MTLNKRFRTLLVLIVALALAGCAPTPSAQNSQKPKASASTSTSPSPSVEPLPDLTPAMAMSASIPSMCEFPAGKLVNGELKKKHPDYPNATLPGIANKDLVIAGDLTGDGVNELAAVFYCDLGGVAWPSHIQLFQSTAKGIAPLGQPFQMGDINGGARGIPESMKFANGQLVIVDRELLPMEAAAAASGKIKVSLKWDGKKLRTAAVQDLANPQNGTLKTSEVNGTWCLASAKAATSTKKCLKVEYPQLTQQGEDPQTLTFSSNNGFTSLNYYDAPLGIVYKPGTKIEDPANPSAGSVQPEKYRLYSNQTQEVFVRQAH